MKIFHLSDLHFGIKLYNKDLYNEQEFVLQQIIDHAVSERPDAIVIAGDIYDKSVPSAEAVSAFDSFISQLNKAVPETEIMVISGNHDSAERVNVFRDILCRHKIHMVGLPPRTPAEYIEKVTLRDEYGDVNFYLLPFVKPSMVKAITGTSSDGSNLSYNEAIHKLIEREQIDDTSRNVLVSHQFYTPVGIGAEEVFRSDSEIRSIGNIDEVKGDVLNVFDYAALGHIHTPMNVGDPRFCYCGTPYTYSISEEGHDKSISVAILGEKGQLTTRWISLHPMHAVRTVKGKLSEVLTMGCDDYVVVVLTDEVDLDVFDMQDRLRAAFPNLLTTHRESDRDYVQDINFTVDRELEPFELCSSFLSDVSDEDREFLRDIINYIQGVTE